MKRTLKGLAVLSMIAGMIPASATIARLKALGMDETDNEGSYYIDDNRNIFLNVANIHNYKDSVILEWGGSGSNFGSASLATDKDASPKAKGGFIKSHGDYVYGVYLGNESNTAALLRGVATGAYAAQATLANTSQGLVADTMLDGADNQLDVFFGGEAANMKWAVNAVYTQDHDQANRARDIGHAVRLGVIADKWNAFANISTGSNARQTDTVNFVPVGGTFNGSVNHEFDGQLGFQLGGAYEVMDGAKVYAFVKKFDWEQKDSAGTTAGFGAASLNGRGQAGTVKGGFTTYALGYGQTKTIGAGTLFTNAEFRSKSINLDFTTKAEAKNVFIPVTVGYEYQAVSWLTLRGSVTQKLWGYRENNNYSSLSIIGKSAADTEFGTDTGGKKVTFENTTTVNGGASLNFGKLVIDGLIGLGGANGTVAATGKDGVLDMDRLLARVGMTYSF